MLPIVANGQPAVGAYFRGEAYGIAVLTPTATGLTSIHVFSTPSLVTYFGLPLTPPAP
jgi:RNA polymerase sigma-70 factor (ECF subfamily)